MFELPRTEPWPDSQTIYRSALTPSRSYTYASVKSAARAFGEGLRSAWDWQKNDVLAIYAPNDIDFGAVVYGAFFAGGIVSPANPGYSAREFAYQLRDCGAKAIVTHASVVGVAVEAAGMVGIPRERVILMGERDEEKGKGFKHFSSVRKLSGTDRYRRRKADPDKDLAFLVYSSGTTGLPKGVMLSHRNIVADVLMIKGAVGKNYSWEKDKFLGVLPFFHIYGLTGLIHQTLHRGIELVVMPSFNLEVFCRTIQDQKITFVYVAPPVLVRLANDPLVSRFDLRSLRMITSGAAPLTSELVHKVRNRIGVTINQAYGLSETAPMTHTQPWEDWEKSIGSVGKMFPNITAKYMRPDGSEAGPDESGELWMKGPNVFKGYWKNEAATKGCLTDDGYFKTGDVGFQDEHQNFYITDRVKELIKYKGFQVAPAELEGYLHEHPMVEDVCVLGVEDKEMHTEIPRAFVVRNKSVDVDLSAEIASKKIVDWLANEKEVASHKRLRGGVIFVEEIPKSAAGKILRRILKDNMLKAEKEGGLKAKL